MRFCSGICVALALGVLTARCDGAEKLVAPDDNLLASATYVMDAAAVKQVAERDWLFKGYPMVGWIRGGRSPYFVGWWNVAPEGSERWAVHFPVRPAPANAAALQEGKRYLVVADDEFHLLSVYPVDPEAGLSMRGMNEREFREHVVSVRMLHLAVSDFLTAVTNADWTTAARSLCAPMREEMLASSDPDAHLAELGVPRIRTTALTGGPRDTINVARIAEAEAQVVVQGHDGRRARLGSRVWAKVSLTLTRTRRMMGPMGWEIVRIETIEERPRP
jgi:hypothetical protein